MTQLGVRVKQSDEVILLLITLIAAARQKLKLWFLNGSFGSKRSKLNFLLRSKVIIKLLSPNYRKQFTSKLKEMLV